MDFDNCINKFNKNDLSLDNLSFECRAVICENFHDVYIPFDNEEMSTDAMPGLFASNCF